jgi:3-hydroxybutyryl-CoA dehydrogenase
VIDEGLPVGVIGCGTMGSGIAEAFARAGATVRVVVLDDAHAAAGQYRIGDSLRRSVEHQRLTDEEAVQAARRISFVFDLAELAEVSLIIESIPERLDAKREVFASMGGVCKPEAILATNTSSLPVIDLGAASGRPNRVIGLHFFNPAPVMRLVELVGTVATDQDALDEARRVTESLGKTVVSCRDRTGFIANLLLFPYLNEAVKLLDAGVASAEDVDTAMRLGANHPMGPLQLIDLIGLDACMQILESLHTQFAEPRFAPSPAFRELVTAGFTGRKAGRGFYVYEAGAADPPSQGRGPRKQANGRLIWTLGIAGTGMIGAGLAETAAGAGFRVVWWGRSEESCARGRASVERSTQRLVDKGKLSAGDRDELLGRIETTAALGDLSPCELVIEAVVEDMAVKGELFEALDEATPDQTILCTATSSLSVIDLAARTRRAHRVAGLHVFNPVPVMRLVEVVRTVATDEETTATALALCRQLRKTAVVCRDRAGFIVNRLLFPYLNDAVRMVEEGYATAADIDAAMTLGCNHPIGPLALIDLVGLDVTLEILRSLHAEFNEPGFAPRPLLEHMVRAGYLGRKAGRGLTVTADR